MEKKLDELINKRSIAYNAVLQKHKIIPEATYLKTIRKGIQYRGLDFQTDLIRALSPGLSQSNLDDDSMMGPPPPAGSFVNDEGVTIVPGASGNSGGAFFSWLSNALGAANSVGDTIRKLRGDITGGLTAGEAAIAAEQQQKKSKQTKVLIIGAVVAIVVMVLVLVIKKKGS